MRMEDIFTERTSGTPKAFRFFVGGGIGKDISQTVRILSKERLITFRPILHDRFRDIGQHDLPVLIVNIHRRFADAVVRIAALDAGHADVAPQNIVGKDGFLPLDVRGFSCDQLVAENVRFQYL